MMIASLVVANCGASQDATHQTSQPPSQPETAPLTPPTEDQLTVVREVRGGSPFLVYTQLGIEIPIPNETFRLAPELNDQFCGDLPEGTADCRVMTNGAGAFLMAQLLLSDQPPTAETLGSVHGDIVAHVRQSGDEVLREGVTTTAGGRPLSHVLADIGGVTADMIAFLVRPPGTGQTYIVSAVIFVPQQAAPPPELDDGTIEDTPAE